MALLKMLGETIPCCHGYGFLHFPLALTAPDPHSSCKFLSKIEPASLSSVTCSFHGSSLSQSALSLPAFLPPPPASVSARLLSEVQTFMEQHLDVQDELKTFITSKASAVNAALDQAVSPLFSENFPEASLLASGKRVRPVLCLAACELVGGTAETAMPAACAVEVIHKMSLRLDAMGNETVREERRRAILSTGSAMVAFAFQHIANATKGVTPERLTRVIRELGKAGGVDGFVSGLVVERATQGDPTIDLEVLDFIHLHKTAALLEGSVVSGAILGGGSEAAVERLRRYARFVSLLFEVVVDILDDASGSPSRPDKRATYTELLGVEGSKQLARRLNRQAKDHLSMFDPIKAAPFHNVADYVLDLID